MAIRTGTQRTQTRGADRPVAPPGSGRAGMEKQEDAARTGTQAETPIETRIEECVGLLRQELQKSDPEELDGTLDLFQEALGRPSATRPPVKAELVRRLSGGAPTRPPRRRPWNCARARRRSPAAVSSSPAR